MKVFLKDEKEDDKKYLFEENDKILEEVNGMFLCECKVVKK